MFLLKLNKKYVAEKLNEARPSKATVTASLIRYASEGVREDDKTTEGIK